MPETYFPVLLALGVALLIGLGMIGLSYFAGRKRMGRTELTPYESGMPMLDRSHKRISIIFFLIAIDFIVFDLEAVFLYPWALVVRAGGWPLFGAVMVFVALILVGYVYVWKKGGLDLAAARPELGRKASFERSRP